jgi:hypothetical protein
MLYFSNSGSVQTLTIWPEVSASIALQPSGGLDLRVVQDYDQSETIIPATLQNTPTRYTPRLVFSILTANVPQYGGLYTVELREFIQERPKWGTTDVKWTDANWRWSDASAKYNISTIDTDRGTVEGLDTPQTIQYLISSSEYIYGSGVGTVTEYIGPDETGVYTTYHL